MRCLTLADALRSEKTAIHFISRKEPGDAIGIIQARGYAVYTLPPHAQAVEVSPEEDAKECLPLLDHLKPDWLIVDHYRLDKTWQQPLRRQCRQLMVIDDLANRVHDCDLLLDQNWFAADTDCRYANLVPSHCTQLLGPGYAMLQPEFSALRKLLPERDGDIRRILISMGGSDPTNETVKILQALMAPHLRHLAVDVVCGQNHPDMASVESAALERGATRVYSQLPSLAGLMLRADFMIGAGGATTWERFCLGLPALVISTADNQYRPSLRLAEAGYIYFAGQDNEVTAKSLQRQITQIIHNTESCRLQSRAGQRLVSGAGTADVASVLTRIISPT